MLHGLFVLVVASITHVHGQGKIPSQARNGEYKAGPVADPGFPVVGGVDLVGGGVDSRGGYVSKILYVKMKELGPLGGARARRAPPRSANEGHSQRGVPGGHSGPF